MIETKPKTIGDLEFQVTQFPGRASFKIKAKLIKLLGPGILTALGGERKAAKPKRGEAESASLDMGAIARGIQMFAEGMDPDDMVNFAMELLSTTQMKVNGNWVPITGEIFDMQFAGKMNVVYQLLGFVLGVNYGSFFAEGGIGATILNKTGMGAVPPNT